MDEVCRADVWETSDVFLVIQTFPFHILYYMLAYRFKYTLFNHEKDILPHLCTPRWRALRQMFDIKCLPPVDWEAFGIMLNSADILEHIALCVMFSRRPPVACEILGCYCSTLVYSDMTKYNHVRKPYGDYIMFIGVEDFNKRAFKLPDTVFDVTGKESVDSARFTLLHANWSWWSVSTWTQV